MKTVLAAIITIFVGLGVAGMAMAEEITIVGTGDGVAILKAIGKAFSQENPEVTITVPKSIGSGGGIKAVGQDQFKLGRVARGIRDKEKPFGLSYRPYAKVPIVLFVNKSVGIRNLTSQQVCDIFSGATTNWKEVGGNASKIRVIRREEGDSSLKNLRRAMHCFKNITITSKSKTTFTTPETMAAVETIAGSIGFGPNDVASRANVAVVTLDGMKPMNKDYPSTTTLALIFKEANNTGNLQKFIEFTASPATQQTITEAGGLPFTGQ